MKTHYCIISLLSFFLSSAQNYTEYATGSSVDVEVNPDFGICMMGGASENDNAMIWFLEKANGGDVVILRASGSNGYNNYMYSQLGVTINSVTTFVIHNEAGALDPYVLQKVENAEAIWFAGGDQFDYVSYFKGNAMETALNNFVNVKQGVIGGASAGMAILGGAYFSAENGTVTNAQALSNPYHTRMTLGYNDFLQVPFLENIVTDTHYDDPDRRARHTTFLARYATDNNSRSFGIACNEYTAVCIDNLGIARVFGDYPNYPEFAYFLQSNCVDDYLPETCVDGQPLTWNKGTEAVKVAKIPGVPTGTNFFDVSNWTAGLGESWENWYVNNGTFTTTVTVDPLCAPLSLDEVSINTVKVYPNPFSDYIIIEGLQNQSQVSLLSINGALIKKVDTDKPINTSDLASGVYFLKVNSNEYSQTFKLIKQ